MAGPKAQAESKQKAEEKPASGVWSLFLRRQKYKVANLGEESSMYYNEELKRWVERGKEAEAAADLASAAAPPKVVVNGAALSGPAGGRKPITARYVLQEGLGVISGPPSAASDTVLLHNSGPAPTLLPNSGIGSATGPSSSGFFIPGGAGPAAPGGGPPKFFVGGPASAPASTSNLYAAASAAAGPRTKPSPLRRWDAGQGAQAPGITQDTACHADSGSTAMDSGPAKPPLSAPADPGPLPAHQELQPSQQEQHSQQDAGHAGSPTHAQRPSSDAPRAEANGDSTLDARAELLRELATAKAIIAAQAAEAEAALVARGVHRASPAHSAPAAPIGADDADPDVAFERAMHPGRLGGLDGPLPWELPDHLRHSDQFISICANWQANNPSLIYSPELLPGTDGAGNGHSVGTGSPVKPSEGSGRALSKQRSVAAAHNPQPPKSEGWLGYGAGFNGWQQQQQQPQHQAQQRKSAAQEAVVVGQALVDPGPQPAHSAPPAVISPPPEQAPPASDSPAGVGHVAAEVWAAGAADPEGALDEAQSALLRITPPQTVDEGAAVTGNPAAEANGHLEDPAFGPEQPHAVEAVVATGWDAHPAGEQDGPDRSYDMTAAVLSNPDAEANGLSDPTEQPQAAEAGAVTSAYASYPMDEQDIHAQWYAQCYTMQQRLEVDPGYVETDEYQAWYATYMAYTASLVAQEVQQEAEQEGGEGGPLHDSAWQAADTLGPEPHDGGPVVTLGAGDEDGQDAVPGPGLEGVGDLDAAQVQAEAAVVPPFVQHGEEQVGAAASYLAASPRAGSPPAVFAAPLPEDSGGGTDEGVEAGEAQAGEQQAPPLPAAPSLQHHQALPTELSLASGVAPGGPADVSALVHATRAVEALAAALEQAGTPAVAAMLDRSIVQSLAALATALAHPAVTSLLPGPAPAFPPPTPISQHQAPVRPSSDAGAQTDPVALAALRTPSHSAAAVHGASSPPSDLSSTGSNDAEPASTAAAAAVAVQMEALRAELDAVRAEAAGHAEQLAQAHAAHAAELAAARDELKAQYEAQLEAMSCEVAAANAAAADSQAELEDLVLALGQESTKVNQLAQALLDAGLDPGSVIDPIEAEYVAMGMRGEEQADDTEPHRGDETEQLHQEAGPPEEGDEAGSGWEVPEDDWLLGTAAASSGGVV